MSVLTALHETVFASGAPEASEETFEYRCSRCGSTFEEPKLKMTRVSCPGCTSTDVRSVD
jgi:Zn finger protein HypA/HybF involved in hydrogenase expression